MPWTRAKQQAYMVKYREKNRDKMLLYQREWYAKNRPRIMARKARWRDKNPQSLKLYERRCNLKTKYNMSLADYDSMVTRQNGLCLICSDPGPLIVDHDHKTGEVRGLLCQNCNLMLGHSRDSAAILEAGIAYLKAVRDEPQAQQRLELVTVEKVKGVTA